MIWLALVLTLLLLLAAAGWRRRAAAHALPQDWRIRLYTVVPQAAFVPDALRPLYEARVETFLREKRFVPCQGLDLREEMRIAVAGLACLLILRPEAKVFPAVRAVLVYPDAFLVPPQPDELGLVADEPEARVGESWSGDRVVLSWPDVAAALDGDAVNVVVHEFAHQLDDEGPDSLGAPPMEDYEQWAQVMRQEYERLQRHRRPPVLDPYGAESPAEFFGVVVEAFFQNPVGLRRHHAALYALLVAYFRLDPAAQGEDAPTSP